MGKINWGRVLVGGLLAGVVMNILGWGIWYLYLRTVWTSAMQEAGRPIQETGGFVVFWTVWYVVLGITAVWLYAAIRPRFGPGPKTAAIAGFAYWLVAGLIPAIAWSSLMKLSARLLVTDQVTYLVILVVATVAGAWAYKEA